MTKQYKSLKHAGVWGSSPSAEAIEFFENPHVHLLKLPIMLLSTAPKSSLYYAQKYARHYPLKFNRGYVYKVGGCC